MAERLTVEITGRDGVTKVFTAIAQSADKAGDTVEQAGKQGAKGLNEMGKAAQENASKMDRVKAEATAVGAVMGTLFAGVSKAGEAFRDQQRQVDGITRLYGDQADAILEMSERIQDFTRYSNDAAREGALIASSLSTNYGLTADQISILVERSADLAQVFGVDLADAVQRTSGALRGEGEAAERLGLNMSDAAVAARALDAGITNWGVPGALTEAEKAAFRFQVFVEDTQGTLGAAAAAADNAGGGFREFINILDDGVEAAGGFLGPVGQVAAEFAPIALYAPIAGAGIGKLNDALGKSAIAAGVGRTAMVGLRAVVSPLGLAMTGVLAIGGLLAASWLDQKAKAEEYRVSLSTLDDTLEMLRRRGDTALAGLGDSAQSAVEGVREQFKEFEDFDAYLKAREQEIGETIYYPSPEYNAIADEWAAAMETIGGSTDDTQKVIDRFNEALNDPNINAEAYLNWAVGLIEAASATAELTDDAEALNTILAKPLSDFSTEVAGMEQLAEATRAAKGEFLDLFNDLPGMLDDLRIDGQGGLATQLEGMHVGIVDAFTLTSAEAQGIVRGYETAMPSPEIFADVTRGLTESLELTQPQVEQLGAAWERITGAMESGTLDNVAVMRDFNAILSDTSLTAEQQVAAITAMSQGMDQYIDSAKAMNEAHVEFLADGANILDWWQQYDQLINQGAGALDSNASEVELFLQGINRQVAELERADFQNIVQLAEDLGDSGTALDQVLRTFSQIDSLGSRSSSAGAIADALFGEGGDPYDSIGPLRELYDAGRIGQTQFNDAANAGIAIQESNLRVQEDLNVVRANQIPLLAEQQRAYEANVSALADMEAAEQQQVLMLQDSAVQAQIATAYSTAYSASLGEIPRDVATEIIANTAQADPALGDLLVKMGLLNEEIGPNGEKTFSVNFPGADATIGAINRMTIAFLNFQAVAENTTAYELAIEIYGQEEADELFGKLEEKDGSRATVTLAADDLVTGAVAIAQSSANSLTGKDVTLSAQDAVSAVAADAQRAVNSLTGKTVDLRANNLVSGAVNAAQAAIDSLRGRSVTNTVTTNYRTIGAPAGIGPTRAHGGMAEYALGGNVVPIWAGEAGPEIAHFPSGGVAMLPREGMYTVPQGSYIEPANSARASVSAPGPSGDVHLHIYGNVYGIDDLADAIEGAIVQRRRGYGSRVTA